MDGGGCACVRACAGAALEEMAHGRDIFGKVKDLRVGRMQGKQRGKERDCVELIDLRAAEEGDASLKVLVDARCCSLGAITFTSDFCATTLPNPAVRRVTHAYKPLVLSHPVRLLSVLEPSWESCHVLQEAQHNMKKKCGSSFFTCLRMFGISSAFELALRLSF